MFNITGNTVLRTACFIAIGLGGYYWAARPSVRAMAQSTVKATAFTVNQETISYVEDLAGTLVEQRTVARRSEGSRALLVRKPKGPDDVALRRVDLSNGKVAMIVDDFRLKSSGFMPERDLAVMKSEIQSPAPNCGATSEKVNGHAQLKGIDVISVTYEREDTRVTEWRAPQLQCFALQAAVERKDGAGQWRLVAEKKPTVLVLGEPSPALFEINATYEEHRPSEVLQQLYAHAGLDMASAPECASSSKLKATDDIYAKSQTPAVK